MSDWVPPIRRTAWEPCVRIVPSRYPPIDLFERVADPADFESVFAIEALTNARLREEVGELSLVPARDRVSGPGASWVMATFTHVAPPGGRFSTGNFGAYYCARTLETAVAETRYHREAFLRATQQGALELSMRVIHATLDADLHDLRGLALQHPEFYSPTEYAASQALAGRLRVAGAWGIAWDSVRQPGGECAAVLRPPALASPRQAQHLTYLWDGERITHVYQKTLLGM
ncbi:MAG: RES family NAD+ phosphorylase [Gemmatimonadetes bacterium]|nr:RES family NAD+ phosphorylase [Gemmatimonadota bacterium]MCC6771426.1 RES family NAD+ phosphorylase [Gemmatimonadaceae bacterium]